MAVAFLSAQRSKDPATQVNSLLSQMQFIHSYCSVVFFSDFFVGHIYQFSCPLLNRNGLFRVRAIPVLC